MSLEITRSWNNTPISRRADGYVNATAMCKANGKQWKNFRENDSTEKYLWALSGSVGIPTDLLVASITTGLGPGQCLPCVKHPPNRAGQSLHHGALGQHRLMAQLQEAVKGKPGRPAKQEENAPQRGEFSSPATSDSNRHPKDALRRCPIGINT